MWLNIFEIMKKEKENKQSLRNPRGHEFLKSNLAAFSNLQMKTNVYIIFHRQLNVYILNFYEELINYWIKNNLSKLAYRR